MQTLFLEDRYWVFITYHLARLWQRIIHNIYSEYEYITTSSKHHKEIQTKSRLLMELLWVWLQIEYCKKFRSVASNVGYNSICYKLSMLQMSFHKLSFNFFVKRKYAENPILQLSKIVIHVFSFELWSTYTVSLVNKVTRVSLDSKHNIRVIVRTNI